MCIKISKCWVCYLSNSLWLYFLTRRYSIHLFQYRPSSLHTVSDYEFLLIRTTKWSSYTWIGLSSEREFANLKFLQNVNYRLCFSRHKVSFNPPVPWIQLKTEKIWYRQEKCFFTRWVSFIVSLEKFYWNFYTITRIQALL